MSRNKQVIYSVPINSQYEFSLSGILKRKLCLLCFASVLNDTLLMGHQSWVHLLPVADIVEHIASYILALQGLCLRSKEKKFYLGKHNTDSVLVIKGYFICQKN